MAEIRYLDSTFSPNLRDQVEHCDPRCAGGDYIMGSGEWLSVALYRILIDFEATVQSISIKLDIPNIGRACVSSSGSVSANQK